MTFAQTYISAGAVSGNWDVSGSPYEIYGDIWVQNGDNLFISDNVIVKFMGHYSLTIESGADFSVCGSNGFEVLFTADNISVGWLGIDIQSNSTININHAIFEYVNKSGSPCNSFAGSGAVFLNSVDNTSFNHCIFRYNEVCSGGGIYATSSKLMANECLFHNNTVTDNGGGIYLFNASSGSYVTDCMFQQNTATLGGGIYMSNCSNDLSFSGNTLSLNEAIDGAGAYFTNLSLTNAPVIGNNQFTYNTASGNGGGIYIVSSVIDLIIGGEFIENFAVNGGGLYVTESEISSLELLNLNLNEAGVNGGGILLYQSHINLILSKLFNNSSANFGAGIYIEGIHISSNANKIINCLIVDNIANSHGGGIFTKNSFYSYSNTIANNTSTSGQGGGIYHDNCSSTIVNTILWGNIAFTNPDAFPTPDENNGYSYCCSPIINNNTTSTTNDPDFVGNGNYMISYNSSCYNSGDNRQVQGSYDIEGNDRILFNVIDIGAYEDLIRHVCGNINTNRTWTDHNPHGIDYVITCDATVVSGVTLTIDAGTTIAFHNNSKMDIFGAINATGTQNSLITFTATSGNNWAGIRFFNNTSSSTLSYCDISNISKPSTGYCSYNDPDYSGAIYLKNCSTYVTISNSKIHDNDVCDCGGGIYMESSSPTINNNEIYNNTANRAGGGIAIYSGQPSIYLNFIENNECTTNGGGIYNLSTSPITIYNNLLDNNYANFNGGGLYLGNNTSTTVYNCTIADNTANGGYGGGIYHGNNSTATSINNIIWGNTAYYPNYSHIYIDPGSSVSYSFCCSDSSISSCSYCTNDNPNFIGNGNYMISYLLNASSNKESSCYNKGYDNVPVKATYDIEGNARTNNDRIDIGAYEDPCFYGEICNKTWTNRYTGTDYIVSGPLKIPNTPNTCTLTINPGTTVAFKKEAYLDVDGIITAQGDVDYPVTFTAYDPNDGWYGIDITSNSNTNQFDYCIFEKVKKTTGGARDDFNSSGTVYLEESNNTTFDHCLFQNNSVSHSGGGLFFWKSKVNLNYCVFNNNNTTGNVNGKKGGGVFMKYPGNSSNSISNCTFNSNTANAGGGGIAINGAGVISISDCTFHQNQTNTHDNMLEAGGGALLVLSKGDDVDINISGCQFINNKALNSSSYSNGGGIMVYNYNPSSYTLKLEVSSSVFSLNEADASGGGIFLYDIHDTVTIHSTFIQNNTAEGDGGGIYMYNLDNDPIIYNNLITGNTADGNGGGIYIDASNPKIYNCTVADNECDNQSGYAGGVYFDGSSQPEFRNTIAWWNIPANTDVKEDGVDADVTDNITYDYCNIRNFSTNTGNNINDNPEFVDHTTGDYRLSLDNSSPCIGTGDNNISPIATHDLKGHDRILPQPGGTIDMGAYEYEYPNPSYKIAKGDSVISEIEVIGKDVLIYPNPAKNFIWLSIESEKEEVVTISIVDILGKVKWQEEANLNKGMNQYLVYLNDMAYGVYFLNIKHSKSKTKTYKIIFN